MSDSTTAPSPASTTSTASRAVIAERLAHLARHEVCDLHRGLDELVVPAAGVGHAAQERLVEVGAHPEGAS